MSANEYLQAEEDLPAYATVPEGTTMEDLWVQLHEEAISGELPSTSDKIEMEDNSDDEDAGSDMETPEATLHTIHTFDEAIRVLHDLLYFLMTKGEESLADDLLSVIQGLNDAKWQDVRSTRQSTLLEFFSPR